MAILRVKNTWVTIFVVAVVIYLVAYLFLRLFQSHEANSYTTIDIVELFVLPKGGGDTAEKLFLPIASAEGLLRGGEIDLRTRAGNQARRGAQNLIDVFPGGLPSPS